MRRIAIINQKGGVGKTTTAANLGSALARLGRRVVLVDLDPQANLSLHLGTDLASGEPSSYDLLLGNRSFGACLRKTGTPGLRLLPAHIDLSGAELELASAFGRETLLREAIDQWASESQEATGEPPADYVILDCPPSLGLLSVNGLAAAQEVIVTLQTEFFALQGISKLVEIVQLMRRRINPALTVAGILPTLYDTRLKLAREVLAEIRRYFPDQVFSRPIRTNIKLAEAPSHGVSIFEYAPSSPGAHDYLVLAREIMAAESQDPELAGRDLPVPAVEQLKATLAQMSRASKASRAATAPELPTVELTPPARIPPPRPDDAQPPGQTASTPSGGQTEVASPVSAGAPDAGPEPSAARGLESTAHDTTVCLDFNDPLDSICDPKEGLAEETDGVPAGAAQQDLASTPVEEAPNYNFLSTKGAERDQMPSRSRLGPLAKKGLDLP